MPLFCQISYVLLVEDHFFFLTNKLFTEKFDDHHHAFRVLHSAERFLLKMSELKFHKLFDIQNSYTFQMNVCTLYLHSQCFNSTDCKGETAQINVFDKDCLF